MTRMVISVLYAFLLGSVFIKSSGTRRDLHWSSDQADALIGTVFLSLNVVGTTAMTMAIPVAKRARDVFYKHRASGMIGHNSMFLGLAVAELPYLLALSFLFVLVYCAAAGLYTSVESFFWFVFFFFLHTASYSYFAQCFMCLVRDEKTVGALQGVWIGLNLFYAGFVVLPQNFFSFFWLGLWINASRYALEGIIFSQFEAIPIQVTPAEENSPLWFKLNCHDNPECSTSLLDYASFYFGGYFTESHRGIDVGVLIGWNLLALFGTWFCLKKFNYVNT
jgi:ABC-type multidrug transport system permease subunit